MNTFQFIRLYGLRLGCVFGLLTPTVIRAEDGEITAVCSRVSDDYVRTRLPGGGFETETYAFGEGGNWRGTMKDASIDDLKFMDIARTISRPLEEKNFICTRDPSKTKLLIMVYWGTTTGSGDAANSLAYRSLAQANGALINAKGAFGAASRSDALSAQLEMEAAGKRFDSWLALASMENRLHEIADAKNASMLGYDAEGIIGTDYGRGLRATALRLKWEDLTEEIEQNRYFVVLMAYDFQLMWKKKKPKLLWEIRYSIRQRGNDFDQQLAAMTRSAARYFGLESHGLIRKPQRQESIRLDEIKILDDK